MVFEKKKKKMKIENAFQYKNQANQDKYDYQRKEDRYNFLNQYFNKRLLDNQS